MFIVHFDAVQLTPYFVLSRLYIDTLLFAMFEAYLRALIFFTPGFRRKAADTPPSSLRH